MRIFKIRYYLLFSALFSVGIYFGLPYLNGLSFIDILESQDLTLFLYYVLLSVFFASSIVLLIYIYAVAFFKKDVNKLPYNKATAKFTLLYVALTSCIILIMSLFGEYSFTREILRGYSAYFDAASFYQLFVFGIILGLFVANINTKKYIKGICLLLSLAFLIVPPIATFGAIYESSIYTYSTVGLIAVLFLLATVNFFTHFKTSTAVSKIVYLNFFVFVIDLIMLAAGVYYLPFYFYDETILYVLFINSPLILCSLVFFQTIILFLKNKPKEVPPTV